MTALCPGGGPSGPLPGTDATIGLAGSIVDAFAASLGFPELAPVIAIATAGTVLATDLFCTGDPPADPGITSTDFDNAQNPANPIAYATALGRLKDWVLHNYWWKVCTCTGGGTPAPPLPNLPTGIGTGTGLPTGTVAGPCWDVTLHNAFAAAGPGSPVVAASWSDLAPNLLPVSETTTVSGGGPGGANVVVQKIPTGVSGMALTTTSNTAVVANPVLGTIYFSTTPGAAPIGHLATTIPVGQTTNTATLATVPSGALWWGADSQNTDNNTAHDVTNEFTYSCGGTGATSTPCCPPDPLVDQYLANILMVVNEILANQGAPKTGWAAATAHPGLSGTGSFNIAAGVTGVRATFTTIPSTIRTTPGTPTFYWDLGFVTPLAMTYPLRSLRTVFASQDLPLPIQTDGLAYTLPAGAVVTLTELVPA